MFKMGQIIGLNETENLIKVKDMYDMSVIDVPLDNIIQLQIMPVINDMVLYYEVSKNKIYKVVKIWNIEQSALIRQGNFPLREGEIQMMGLLGQYIYMDRNGTIKFVDSTLLNHFELNVNGMIAKLKEFQIDTYDGTHIKLDKDIIIGNKIIGEEENDEGEMEIEYETTITINEEGINVKRKEVEMIIDNNNEITFKGNKLKLGNQLYGGVVTGGLPSVDNFPTHPVCFMSGSPIPGSKKVKAEQ